MDISMADIVTWGIIIFANFFSILLGAYCFYKVIMAFLNRKDLMKYQGYFIYGFLMIFVLPIFITYGGLKIAEFDQGGKPIVGVEFDVHGGSGSSGNVRLSSNDYVEMEGEKILDLEIENEDDKEKKLNIDVKCREDDTRCNEIKRNIIFPSNEEILLEPRFTIEVPISINISKDSPTGKYDLNLNITQEDGTSYGEVPFSLSIE